MKLNSRCFPSGALAYSDLDPTVRMVAKLFEKTPYLPFLPNIAPEDTILKRTLGNIPGVALNGKKVIFQLGSDKYKQALADLEKACNNPTTELLEPYAIESVLWKNLSVLYANLNQQSLCKHSRTIYTISNTYGCCR